MGVDVSFDTGDDGNVDDYERREKTHFGDDTKDCGNHCFGHVSAAGKLKVKLLPSRCSPMTAAV